MGVHMYICTYVRCSCTWLLSCDSCTNCLLSFQRQMIYTDGSFGPTFVSVDVYYSDNSMGVSQHLQTNSHHAHFVHADGGHACTLSHTHSCMCAQADSHICVRTYTYVHVHTHMRTCVHRYAVCVYACTHTHTHTHRQTNTCVYTCTGTRTYVHACM